MNHTSIHKHVLKRIVGLSVLCCTALHASVGHAAANVAPTVQIISAEMRPGTTLMDVVYRVDDPDDATVKVRTLAFVDGVRSFSNVQRPVTFVEGTDANLGDAIASGVDHTLTWDVPVDWDVDLAQVKFEVLAVDSNGILPFDGITIPAAAGNPELKINQVGQTDEDVFDGLLWYYASGDSNMEVVDGVLQGSDSSGVFNQYPVVVGSELDSNYAPQYLFKLMNIAVAGSNILQYAESATRQEFPRDKWLTTSWPYEGTQFTYGWGENARGQTDIPSLFCDVIGIAAGVDISLILKNDGTVVAIGSNFNGATDVPEGLSNVIKIAAGTDHFLALKEDGTVIGWGHNGFGQESPPEGLSGVIAIAAGTTHSLALKSDGTVVGWGQDGDGILNIPAGLSNVTSIAASWGASVAVKSDGTVVSWGPNVTTPSDLSDVKKVALGHRYGLALKRDGTVVGWGANDYGQIDIPPGLSNVTAIAAGSEYSVALKVDGTVVVWGSDFYGQSSPPAGMSNVTAIAAGYTHCIAITAKVP